MNNIKLTRTNTILSILLLVSIILLPIDFAFGDPSLEIMKLEDSYLTMAGLMLWVFFGAQLITVIMSFLERYDLSIFSGIVEVGSIFLALAIDVIDWNDGAFLKDADISAFLYFLIAAAELIILWKKNKEAS